MNTTPPPSTYQLTVTAPAAGTGTITSKPAGIDCPSQCSANFAANTQVTLTETPGTNYFFGGWSGACSGSSTCTVTITGATSVSATFNKGEGITVAIAGGGSGTVTSSPSGINCPTTCSASYAPGTQVTLTETAATGNTFSGWSGSCTGTASCTVTLNASDSVTATFVTVVSTYPLTVTAPAAGTGTITSNPSGINCPSQCSANFAANTQVTLTETPGSNYFFEGWSGACSGSGTCTVTMTAATSVSAAFTQGESLTVAIAGGGSGTVTSSPSGINCPTTCSASYAPGTQVTLTETAATGNTFSGWSGSCTGTTSCTVTLNASDSVTATFVAVVGVQNLNHIIFIAQENRSFDEYFGYLRQYWANNGIPDQSFDGLPQFNPTTGAPPLQGPVASNPPCSATTGECAADANGTPVPTFHMQSMCTEDMSPFWNESHVAWNAGFDYPSVINWLGNGFVQEAANEARQDSPPINDTNGYRAMGYFTDQDLNYYYFMATNFATSDRWFSPVMTRTQSNRAYIMGATSQGYVYPFGQITPPPIFEALQNAGITWKDYVNTDGTSCSGTGDTLSECLLEYNSYLSQFTYENTILKTAGQNPDLLQNIVPLSQFTTDAQNGTLPQVAMIEPASSAALDEHPSDNDTYTVDIQAGANYIAGLINTLMTSQSWHDSALIFTYDEAGGFYDHVQPQPVPVPDSYAYPRDLQPPYDSCLGADQSTGVCSLAMTGYRIPLIVISPYAKKNYVSHTVRDTTAWLSLVEERFNIPPLNARDGYWLTEKDATTGLPGTMDEFFDFQNPPWMTPPSPPTQNQGGACNLNAPNPFGGG